MYILYEYEYEYNYDIYIYIYMCMYMVAVVGRLWVSTSHSFRSGSFVETVYIYIYMDKLPMGYNHAVMFYLSGISRTS